MTIAFRRSDLQEAFFVPGTDPFRVWGYGTTEPLEQVLAPGYFEHGRGLVCAGELIYVSTTPRDAGGSGGNEARSGDGRRRWVRRGLGAPGPGLRLPERSAGHPQLTCVTAPDATPTLVKRDRPPGSKTKKPAEES